MSMDRELASFTTRPELQGTFGMVASTHWLASAAGMSMLERGGNAFDAGLIAQSAEEAVGAPRHSLPRFRGVVRVRGAHGKPVNLATAGQALDLARRLTEKVHEVRRDWPDVRRLHLFVAGPAGLAMLLGQLANGLGPVQTYEHIPCDAVGRYEPAALIRRHGELRPPMPMCAAPARHLR